MTNRPKKVEAEEVNWKDRLIKRKIEFASNKNKVIEIMKKKRANRVRYSAVEALLRAYNDKHVYWVREDYDERRHSMWEFGNRYVKDVFFGFWVSIVIPTKEYYDLLKSEQVLNDISRRLGHELDAITGYNDAKYEFQLKEEEREYNRKVKEVERKLKLLEKTLE